MAGIDPRRSALLLFDMINRFIYPANAERAQQIAKTGVVVRSVAMVEFGRPRGLRVIYANGAHVPGGKDDAEPLTDTNMDLQPWPDGPRRLLSGTVHAGTPEAEVIPELSP